MSRIVSLAHRLGLTEIAVGVETEAQRAFPEAHNGDHAQGFPFAKPLPLSDLPQMLRAAGE